MSKIHTKKFEIHSYAKKNANASDKTVRNLILHNDTSRPSLHELIV